MADSQKKAKERRRLRERKAKLANMAERHDDIVDAPSTAESQGFSDYEPSDKEETNKYLDRLISFDDEDAPSPEVVVLPPPERCLCSTVGGFLCSPLGATATAAVAGLAAVAGFIILKK